MMFTKKKAFFSAIVVLIMLVVGFYFAGVSFQNKNALTRTVNLADGEIDYQSILSEFEDSTTEKINNKTYFEGYQSLDVSLFDELDNVSLQEKEDMANECRVKYNFSYDSQTNIVTISAEMKNQYGEIEIEELSGVGFINDKNEIDAVLNVEGESIFAK